MKPRLKKLPPFVPLVKSTMNTPAWRELSHGARSLYTALKARYNRNLQNAVYLAGRAAVQELGSHSHRDYVRRWFRELEYYGFIEMVSLAHHGLNGHGRAAHYRLTEEWYLGKPPTRDFLNWDGVIFHEQKSPKAYQTKNRSRGPYVRSALAHTSGPLPGQLAQINGTGGPHVGSICEQDSGPDVGSITSLTTPLLEWHSLRDLEGVGVTEIEVTEAERAELERLANIRQLPCNRPSIPIQINNYDLALGLMASGAQFVSWRDKH